MELYHDCHTKILFPSHALTKKDLLKMEFAILICNGKYNHPPSSVNKSKIKSKPLNILIHPLTITISTIEENWNLFPRFHWSKSCFSTTAGCKLNGRRYVLWNERLMEYQSWKQSVWTESRQPLRTNNLLSFPYQVNSRDGTKIPSPDSLPYDISSISCYIISFLCLRVYDNAQHTINA